MEPLIIKGTNATPNVVLNKDTNEFKISGNSLPEDVFSFYNPIIDWIKKYLESPNKSTVFTFQMVYFNTATSKVFIEIFKTLESLITAGFAVKVNWCYMEIDEDTLESGEEYASLLNIPFEFQKFESF